jgi:hypothetical protein
MDMDCDAEAAATLWELHERLNDVFWPTKRQVHTRNGFNARES